MAALALAALIVLGLGGVVSQALSARAAVAEKNRLTRDARFALARMLRTASTSPRLVLPLRDNPNTDWPEHLREQTIPASPPLGSSTFASAVLAVTLPLDVDLDHDGFADADNDRDGRVDEDPDEDDNFDGYPGIHLVDDDGDGSFDLSAAAVPQRDDDEDGADGEDFLNAIDDDGDGSVDEDLTGDLNFDGSPGVGGVDDDGDGNVDEGPNPDDDEDGQVGEDWLDTVVYYLVGDRLTERMPVPWDVNGDSVVSGADYVEAVIADDVTRFRVERLADGGAVDSVDIRLELTSPVSGETVGLQTRLRVGGAL